IRCFFKHNAHVLWAFTTNQKTNPLAFSYVELTLIKREFDVSDMVPTLSCWDIDYNRIRK
ncbi:hypothetical protein, partial [Porphyromonas gingivalis]|uniref:hypothetical protein n=1 Tax=Porphyromonas gingivalis TaxID=837 RepID=UPI00198100CB